MHTLLQPKRRNNRLPDFMQEIYNGHEWNNGSSDTTQPKVNIIKTETDYAIQLAAPGYKKEDFGIELKDDKLVLSAQEKSSKDTKFQRREFTLAGFKRTFSLSKHEINRNEISAHYENGILNITLPLNKEALSVNKKIDIS